MSLCLVAIFKNESHIIKEWIDHYLYQGVDRFFLIDNDSTDNYKESLQLYHQVEVVIDKDRYSQIESYNKHTLEKCKEYDWVIVCDLDEFIYARKGFKTIKDYLQTIDDSISQIFIPWKIFGSNGYNTIDKDQPNSVIQSFTKRINYDKENDFQGVIKEGNIKYSLTKCIVRTKYLLRFEVHGHWTSITNSITTDNENHIHKNNCFSKIDEQILENSALHLNHYVIQSFQWFMKVKSIRGDVNSIYNNTCRNETYFANFDRSSNDIFDTELYEIYTPMNI